MSSHNRNDESKPEDGFVGRSMTEPKDSTDADDRTPPEDRSGSDVCTKCGAQIDTTEWHPVIAQTEDEFRLHSFCTEDCRNRWADD